MYVKGRWQWVYMRCVAMGGWARVGSRRLLRLPVQHASSSCWFGRVPLSSFLGSCHFTLDHLDDTLQLLHSCHGVLLFEADILQLLLSLHAIIIMVTVLVIAEIRMHIDRLGIA